ncbi:hypothetical protein [Paenibacillus sp. DMB20]|uniref:hypothetical protein n=1 Tax=Paenibacillus sp. DMB20 TaxID=1642570 RepID=UPI000627E497|nr:hypothetical protein [Paenibacillus sp. DMB20]KKO54476.1 hypothetical protein XI25_06625 [Paenibacillus sp. DMB20]
MCRFLFCGRLAAKVKKLSRKVDVLSEQTELLADRVEELEDQVMTGLVVIPELIDFFSSRTGQSVQINTTFATLKGVVLATAVDAVQIRESSGDLVLIPFSSITTVY